MTNDEPQPSNEGTAPRGLSPRLAEIAAQVPRVEIPQANVRALEALEAFNANLKEKLAPLSERMEEINNSIANTRAAEALARMQERRGELRALEIPEIRVHDLPDLRSARSIEELVSVADEQEDLLAAQHELLTKAVDALTTLVENAKAADKAGSRRHWQTVAVALLSAVVGGVVGAVLTAVLAG